MQTLRKEDLDDNHAPRLAVAAADETNETVLEKEDLIEKFCNVKLCFKQVQSSQATEKYIGTLYVTSRRIVWVSQSPSEAESGYSWDIRCITLHAISRDIAAFPEPCLYCQIDAEDQSEVRFIPPLEDDLQKLFTAFSKSAELNPDDEEELGEDEIGDWIYDTDEIESGSREAVISAQFDSMLQVPSSFEYVPGQFEDAEEAHPEDDELL